MVIHSYFKKVKGQGRIKNPVQFSLLHCQLGQPHILFEEKQHPCHVSLLHSLCLSLQICPCIFCFIFNCFSNAFYQYTRIFQFWTLMNLSCSLLKNSAFSLKMDSINFLWLHSSTYTLAYFFKPFQTQSPLLWKYPPLFVRYGLLTFRKPEKAFEGYWDKICTNKTRLL